MHNINLPSPNNHLYPSNLRLLIFERHTSSQKIGQSHTLEDELDLSLANEWAGLAWGLVSECLYRIRATQRRGVWPRLEPSGRREGGGRPMPMASTSSARPQGEPLDLPTEGHQLLGRESEDEEQKHSDAEVMGEEPGQESPVQASEVQGEDSDQEEWQAPVKRVVPQQQLAHQPRCVLLVSVVEQFAQIHNSSSETAMDLLCQYLPEKEGIRGVCTLIVELFGPDLLKLLSNKFNADVICHAMKICVTEPKQPVCHLYKKPKTGLKKSIRQAEILIKMSDYMRNQEIVSKVLFNLCSLPMLRHICDAIDSAEPAEDFDRDHFSEFPSLRGYHWRGRDCNDIDKSVYPGRRPKDWDVLYDSNCNGISGFDPEDGIPYEKKFCDGSETRGVIILGDSAAAHFHIPPEWITASQISKDAFSNMVLSLSNELDWPQFSMVTGFQNSTIGGWTQSLYLKLREWNRCNHRDYQNIARNGGFRKQIRGASYQKVADQVDDGYIEPMLVPIEDSSTEIPRDSSNIPPAVDSGRMRPSLAPDLAYQDYVRPYGIMSHLQEVMLHLRVKQPLGPQRRLFAGHYRLARNQEMDKPVIVFYGMVGNDVCNTYADTEQHMTTPEKMRSGVMEQLQYLDTHLPNGSHVILMSLADGRFLWNSLHDRYHPIGRLNKDVTYAQFYDFLSCLSHNPCEGWMTKNETRRNITTERAEKLSMVLQEIAASERFIHFELKYFENLYQKVSAKWERLGGKPWELLEPVDGFHPNQVASAIGADIIWEEAMQRWPEVFGNQNPFNKEIISKFGDQGGH
ncbi:acyloxyacyl hydrolase [Gastrophryne carolinensis]